MGNKLKKKTKRNEKRKLKGAELTNAEALAGDENTPETPREKEERKRSKQVRKQLQGAFDGVNTGAQRLLKFRALVGPERQSEIDTVLNELNRVINTVRLMSVRESVDLKEKTS